MSLEIKRGNGVNKVRFITLVLLFFYFTANAKEIAVSKGTFITPDREQVKIAYDLYHPEKKSKSVVILLHMLGQNRGDWRKFATNLATIGLSAMALDFRGHGDSLLKMNEQPLFYRDFTNSDFSHLDEDVRGAIQELVRQGYESFAIVGASIGANVAVKFAAKEPGVKALVLLSPGADYRGIRFDAYTKELKVPILLVASKEDSYAYKTSEAFMKSINPKRSKITWEPVNNSGHGTRMLKDKKVVKVIEEFLKKELLSSL